MAQKTYQFYCDACGFKRITQGGSDIKTLYEYKRSPIQKGIPQLDPTTQKVVTTEPMKRKRTFRCPDCGRMISARQIKVVELEKAPEKEVLGQEEITQRIVKRFDLIYGEDKEEDNPTGH
tara:strand:+ start:1848 stop:2207 length:360 start_codon:yes stop_codon:yes gene_type:complete